MESSETVVVFLHSCFSVLGISQNLLLLITMFRHTPSSFATFGVMLKFHVLADLSTLFGCAAAMQRCRLHIHFSDSFSKHRMVPIERSILFISYGPCGLVSPTACNCACVVMFGGEASSIYTILASFVFRLFVIEGKNPAKRTALAIICTVVLPVATAMMIAVCLARTNDADAQYLMNELLPEYGAYMHVVTGQKDIHHPAIIAEFFIMAVLNGPMYMAILYLRPKMLDNLQRSVIIARKCIGNLYRSIQYFSSCFYCQMLSAQALLPILLAFGVITYLIAFFDIYHHPALESSTALVRWRYYIDIFTNDCAVFHRSLSK
ncbi:hypothetical protein PRIPAC_80891, partial [Pristionchus pacificus]|uniref:G protein-coupled receptor n=1 Tax=Pristionchus pacificus TaxID=54126 RepID=A0A2A6CP84_PRIPA